MALPAYNPITADNIHEKNWSRAKGNSQYLAGYHRIGMNRCKQCFHELGGLFEETDLLANWP